MRFSFGHSKKLLLSHYFFLSLAFLIIGYLLVAFFWMVSLPDTGVRYSLGTACLLKVGAVEPGGPGEKAGLKAVLFSWRVIRRFYR